MVGTAAEAKAEVVKEAVVTAAEEMAEAEKVVAVKASGTVRRFECQRDEVCGLCRVKPASRTLPMIQDSRMRKGPGRSVQLCCGLRTCWT